MKVEVESEDFGFELDGEDISNVLNHFQKAMSDYMTDYLMGALNSKSLKALNTKVNGYLATAPRSYIFNEKKLEFDY